MNVVVELPGVLNGDCVSQYGRTVLPGLGWAPLDELVTHRGGVNDVAGCRRCFPRSGQGDRR